MMTQSVMTQAVNLLGSASGSVTSKGKQNGSSFELVIDHSLKANQNEKDDTNNTVQKTSTQTPKKENSKSDAVADDSKQPVKTEKVQDSKTAARTQDKVDTGTTVKDTAQTDDGSEISTDPETMEKIAAMLAAVKETVLDVLNLSSEELDQLLADQGMKLADLLQPENLQQLVLANAGQNNLVSVLTDENLANTMNNLLQSVEDIKNNSGLDISMEQVKDILDSMQQPTQAETAVKPVETVATVNQQEVVQKPEANKEVSDNDKRSTGTDGLHKEIHVEVLKAAGEKESSSGSQSDLTRGENRDLSSAKQYEVFLNNLTNTETAPQVKFDTGVMRITEIREIANQIIQRIRVTIQPEQTSMEMQLNPEHLGKVNLSVQSKSGVMTAQFVVQNEISKEAIESQLHTLRETLNQQGIKVDAIEVTVASYAFDQNPNEQAGSQQEAKKNSGSHITMEEAMNMTDDSEIPEDASELTGISGNTIDYTA